ncbi:MAG: hypothetical protein Q4Q04_00310 [Methanocorpusculum sp.]|nr:hypothetical protein [Methanocorpusculum sp.]
MREFSFPVVSLGSRRESAPDVKAVAAWIASRHGQAADIISYELEMLFEQQLPYAAEPAAGGEFYDERLREAFGVQDGRLVQDFELTPSAIAEDMAVLSPRVKGCRFSLPSPVSLGIADEYFKDEDEFQSAAVDIFLRLCREQRDAGVSGHVVLSDAPVDIELEALHGRKFLWMCPADRLEQVLEVSRDAVLPGDAAGRIAELADSYALRNVYLCDPDAASLLTALETVDADHLFVAGYGRGACDRGGERSDARQKHDCEACDRGGDGQGEYWHSLAGIRVKREEAE